MGELIFHGNAKITIRFQNVLMWQKYRKYVLKTAWDFDAPNHPYTANLEMEFSSMSDVAHICKQIIFLLQMGFEVHSCKWGLDPEYVEHMMTDPNDNGELSDREFLDLFGGYQYIGKIEYGGMGDAG